MGTTEVRAQTRTLDARLPRTRGVSVRIRMPDARLLKLREVSVRTLTLDDRLAKPKGVLVRIPTWDDHCARVQVKDRARVLATVLSNKDMALPTGMSTGTLAIHHQMISVVPSRLNLNLSIRAQRGKDPLAAPVLAERVWLCNFPAATLGRNQACTAVGAQLLGAWVDRLVTTPVTRDRDEMAVAVRVRVGTG